MATRTRTLPFVKPRPKVAARGTVALPGVGVFVVEALAWPDPGACPYPTFVYPPTGEVVSWTLTNVASGECRAVEFEGAAPTQKSTPG